MKIEVIEVVAVGEGDHSGSMKDHMCESDERPSRIEADD